MTEKNYLGIDIGGTYIKYGVVDKVGNILKTSITETPRDTEALLNKINNIITTSHPENLYGVGISSPGKIDIDAGLIHHGVV